jgi:hypothetical protein
MFFQTALNIVCKSADEADRWAGTTSKGSQPVAGYLKEPSPFDRFTSAGFSTQKHFQLAASSKKKVTVVTMVMVWRG